LRRSFAPSLVQLFFTARQAGAQGNLQEPERILWWEVEALDRELLMIQNEKAAAEARQTKIERRQQIVLAKVRKLRSRSSKSVWSLRKRTEEAKTKQAEREEATKSERK